MGKRGRLARVAAVSNGMVWFGLSLFVASVAAGTSSALSGDWFQAVGWWMIVTAAAALFVMGIVEQHTMRAARAKGYPRHDGE